MDSYTLADLLTQWERGEMPLEELIAHWASENATTDDLLHQIVRALAGLMWRVMELEATQR